MSSPSRDGTMTDEVIANAEPKECRGPADGKNRSIRWLDSKHVQHFLHRDRGTNSFEGAAWHIDPSPGYGTAQCSGTVPLSFYLLWSTIVTNFQKCGEDRKKHQDTLFAVR
jgi:hypothetical protein